VGAWIARTASFTRRDITNWVIYGTTAVLQSTGDVIDPLPGLPAYLTPSSLHPDHDGDYHGERYDKYEEVFQRGLAF
jgi:hypothetical protein